MGKVLEVSSAYEVKLENVPDWLEPAENAKRYINKDLVGKEVDIATEQGKIVFIKVLGGNKEEKQDNGDIAYLLKSINLNLGSLAIMNKINIFYLLEIKGEWDKQRNPEIKLIYDYLKEDIGKYISSLKKIKKEQDDRVSY